MKIKVKQGQNLWDVCIMITGDAESIFELARRNNLSVTDPLTQDMELEWEGNPASAHLIPATYRPLPEEWQDLGGIGEMIIGETFIVR